MDPLGDPLTTLPIQTGWEFTIEPYPYWQFWFIANAERQFDNGSGWTWTQTQSDGPELFLTPALPTCFNSCCSQCWNIASTGFHWTDVSCYIFHSNNSFAFCRSAAVHLVVTWYTVFRCTWNGLCCIRVTISAQHRWTSITPLILWILCYCNWWDSLAISSSTVGFRNFDIVSSQTVQIWNGM